MSPMKKDEVRTVPPWIIQQPRQAVSPQHNHAPADPRRHHASSSQSGNNSGHDAATNKAAGGTPIVPGHSTVQASPADNDATAGGVEALETPGVPGTPGTPAAPAAPPTPSTPAASGASSSGSSPPATASSTTLDPTTGLPVATNAGHSGIGRITHIFQRKEGRKWDHLRSAEPVIVPQFHVSSGPRAPREGRRSAAAAQTTSASRASSVSATAGRTPWWQNPDSQWRSFIETTRYPRLARDNYHVVDDEEMHRLNMADFGYNMTLQPKVGGGEGGGGIGHFHNGALVPASLADKSLVKRVWQLLLHHPLGPLACRLTVLSTSIVALIVAAEIFRREHLGSVGKAGGVGSNFAPERAQIIVAIVVDVVAVPYIGYITVDDYTGKPLGLRPVNDRIRLILMDLVFIIFKSASTALGFEAMIFVTTESSEGLVRALGAFELIGLVSWALTLTINVFREIGRLGG